MKYIFKFWTFPWPERDKMKLFRTNTLGHLAFNWLMTSSDWMTSLRENRSRERRRLWWPNRGLVQGRKMFFWNVKILDFWVWDVISYLTSHFGQYKRNIKRRQANIDLQAIGSDTLNSRIRIFEIFKKFLTLATDLAWGKW